MLKSIILNFIDSTANNPTSNTVGALSTSVAFFNSFFGMLNPVLTGIFYVASIGWLGVQIFYKIKNDGK
jgi:hypothetical protein